MITITPHHNGLTLSVIYKGQYYKRIYIFHTRREAIEDFREYVRETHKEIYGNRN